jgi:Short C-terminal domain
MFGPSRRMSRRTARRTSRRVSRRQMAMYDDGGYDEPEPQYAAPPPAEEPDYAEELQKLATLKNQGVISEEEFEAKKKQILGI